MILSILGIAAVLFLLFRYGIPLISDASYMFGRATSSPGNNPKTTTANQAYVAPPDLNSLPTATKDQNVKVTGNSISGEKIVLYLNGVRQEEKDVAGDGSFEFDVSLSEGDNIIKVKAIKGTSESDFSDSIDIAYKNSNPNLSIDNPHDGDNLSGGNVVTVSGKADPDDTVTVNNFQAIIDDQGNWSYGLTLANGGNDINAVATDQAGNQTQKSIHVNYSQ